MRSLSCSMGFQQIYQHCWHGRDQCARCSKHAPARPARFPAAKGDGVRGGASNGQQVRAGALTPLYKIVTVELAMTKVQADHYWKVHQGYAEGLDQVYDWEKKQG